MLVPLDANLVLVNDETFLAVVLVELGRVILDLPEETGKLGDVAILPAYPLHLRQ